MISSLPGPMFQESPKDLSQVHYFFKSMLIIYQMAYHQMLIYFANDTSLIPAVHGINTSAIDLNSGLEKNE